MANKRLKRLVRGQMSAFKQGLRSSAFYDQSGKRRGTLYRGFNSDGTDKIEVVSDQLLDNPRKMVFYILHLQEKVEKRKLWSLLDSLSILRSMPHGRQFLP